MILIITMFTSRRFLTDSYISRFYYMVLHELLIFNKKMFSIDIEN